ncbi:MAG TPA: TRAP transporter substrate-binding protein [Acetobacteraceae bacterium]|nr:TRAP transporter substrate-binding protein [Acetobacteraceae bacterium]
MARWRLLRHTQHMLALRFAGYQPARSVHTRALHALRDGVARRANGAFAMTVTDSIVATGRKAADLLTKVASGELDGCYFASSYLAARVPALGVFDQPFQAGSREQVLAALDGDVGAALAEQVAAATEFRVLGWWDNGIRHISNAVRPIRTPADCVGLRLRTLDNAQHQATFRRLGFRPMFIDVADLPRAVAERTVDAQENPLTNLVNFNLQTYHKHVSLTGHLLGIAPLLVNRARYDALPDELGRMLDAAARESETIQRRLAVAEDDACLRLLAEAGVTIIGSDAIDLEGFRAAVVTPNA